VNAPSIVIENSNELTGGTDADKLVAELTAAFGDAFWPHNSPPEDIDVSNALQVAEELFLVSDATKKFELPRLMSLAIRIEPSVLRSRVLFLLIEFLDVDFDDPDGTNDLLKETKRRVFSSYDSVQSLAILRWLEHIKTAFPKTEYQDLLDSGIKYWRIQADLTSDEKTRF
jgi:hypothetical protein